MFPNTDFNFLINRIKKDEAPAETRVGRSFVFDYEKGQHVIIDGKPKETTELQAVEQWLELLIRTKLKKYIVYQDTNFGTTWENYLSMRQLPDGYIESELEREITENCKEYCPAIARVRNFTARRYKDNLDVAFTAELTNKEILEVKASV